MKFEDTLLRLVRKGHDFTDRQKCVLFAVRETPQTIRAMAESLNVAKPAITRAADKLQVAGLVGRKDDPEDARSVLVFSTKAGKKLLEFIDKE